MNPNPFVDEVRLVTLIKDPATRRRRWDDRAACVDLSPTGDHYFPDNGDLPHVDALDRCTRCPVAHECLATALIHESEVGLRFGWWGGCSPEERELLAERTGITSPQVANTVRRPADVAHRLRSRNRTIASIAAELDCTERTIYRYLAAVAA